LGWWDVTDTQLWLAFGTAIMHFSVSLVYFTGFYAQMQSSFYFLLLSLLLFYFLLQFVCLYVKCVNLLEMGITLLPCCSQLPLVLLTENLSDKWAVSWNFFEQRSSEQSTL